MEDESYQLAFEIRLHVQEFKAKHLRLERDGMGAVEAGVVSLVHDGARVFRLLAYGMDGSFEDVALTPGRGLDIRRPLPAAWRA